MAFTIGETAGDYQIIGILGTGGMGKVYKVRNVISDRVEAMKVLLPDLANETELADRFMREIKLLASLNHTNIAALHTATRMGNQLLMMMEFVEGRTLEDRLKEGTVPVREAVDYVCQALSALGYAHERGVVHRDIKPANMMVTSDGQVKLMDFGIAKAVADRRLTMTGTTLGSLFYMSPEQVKGSADLDGRSDLYSMGVALYELVTGTRPFKGDSDYSIMVAHLEQQAIPPIQVDPTLPPVLNEIIMAAIEKDPANRFQAAQAFRAALESVMPMLPQAAGSPVAARPAAPQSASVPTRTAAPPAQAPRPQPAAAPIPPPRQPQPAPAAMAASAQAGPQRSGHRGLWMALGAVLAIAVLAVAAIQVPKWYRTRAGAPPQEVTPAQSPAAAVPAPASAEPAAQPVADATTSTPAAEAPAAAPAVTANPAPAAAVVPSRPTAREPRRAAPSSSFSPAEPAAPAPQEQSAPAPAQQAAPAAPAVDTAALDDARERLSTLAPRANALRSTLQNLEQQQKAQGVGMRMDISTSWRRMEGLLDEAEAAIKGGDAARAKTKLDQAEREADKLDKFLGH